MTTNLARNIEVGLLLNELIIAASKANNNYECQKRTINTFDLCNDMNGMPNTTVQQTKAELKMKSNAEPKIAYSSNSLSEVSNELGDISASASKPSNEFEHGGEDDLQYKKIKTVHMNQLPNLNNNLKGNNELNVLQKLDLNNKKIQTKDNSNLTIEVKNVLNDIITTVSKLSKCICQESDQVSLPLEFHLALLPIVDHVGANQTRYNPPIIGSVDSDQLLTLPISDSMANNNPCIYNLEENEDEPTTKPINEPTNSSAQLDLNKLSSLVLNSTYQAVPNVSNCARAEVNNSPLLYDMLVHDTMQSQIVLVHEEMQSHVVVATNECLDNEQSECQVSVIGQEKGKANLAVIADNPVSVSLASTATGSNICSNDDTGQVVPKATVQPDSLLDSLGFSLYPTVTVEMKETNQSLSEWNPRSGSSSNSNTSGTEGNTQHDDSCLVKMDTLQIQFGSEPNSSKECQNDNQLCPANTFQIITGNKELENTAEVNEPMDEYHGIIQNSNLEVTMDQVLPQLDSEDFQSLPEFLTDDDSPVQATDLNIHDLMEDLYDDMGLESISQVFDTNSILSTRPPQASLTNSWYTCTQPFNVTSTQEEAVVEYGCTQAFNPTIQENSRDSLTESGCSTQAFNPAIHENGSDSRLESDNTQSSNSTWKSNITEEYSKYSDCRTSPITTKPVSFNALNTKSASSLTEWPPTVQLQHSYEQRVPDATLQQVHIPEDSNLVPDIQNAGNAVGYEFDPYLYPCNVLPDEAIPTLPLLPGTRRPLRVGLSRRQHVHPLHESFAKRRRK